MAVRYEAIGKFGLETAESYRIVPRGVSEVYTAATRGGLAINQNVDEESYASAYPVIWHNSKINHLEAEFFGATTICDHEGTTQIIPTVYTADGRLAIVAQAAGYAERSALIVASNRWDFTPEELEYYGHKLEPALFSANLNTATRTGYVAATLAGLQVAYQYAGDEIPVGIEHNTPAVSQGRAPVSRSIPLPHTTLAIIDASQFKPREEEIEHLNEEQELLTEKMRIIMAGHLDRDIRRRLWMKFTNPKQVEVTSSGEEPLGPRIHFRDITPDNLTEPKSVKFVRNTLNAAHAGYQAFATEVFWETPAQREFRHFFAKRSQPATRLIYHFHPTEGHLVAAISPIASRAGGMEAMGIDLRRGVDYPLTHSTEEITVFQKVTGERIQETADRLRSPQKPRTGAPRMTRRGLLFAA